MGERDDKKRRWQFLGFALFAAASQTVAAEYIESPSFWDGNKFHEACKGNPRQAADYALGVFDGFSAGVGYLSAGQQICLVRGVTWQQVVDMSCQAVASDAGLRHLPASVIISLTLMQEFPCR